MAVAQNAESRNGPSIFAQLAVLAALTVAAGGIGWLSGSFLSAGIEPVPEGAAQGASANGTRHDATRTVTANPLVLDIGAITTNLASPADTWVRLEVSVVLEEPAEDPLLAETIQQDLLAFLRTVKLHQIEGASGFQHLKADLLDRASVRTGGKAKAVLVRTLLFE